MKIPLRCRSLSHRQRRLPDQVSPPAAFRSGLRCAVDGQDLTRYIACQIAGEKQIGVGDLLRLADAAERLWRNIVDKKLYVTGGIGGTVDGEAFSYNYDLPNDSAYSETCAAISLAFFARRMLELAPKAEYADVMESALYNTTLAGMALDGKSFFYVNPLEVNPYACHKDSRLRHVKPVRQKWFGCACCPPNIARIVESVQEYAYTVAEDGGTLFTHLYMGGVAKAELNGTAVELDVTANLPWQGDGKAVVRLGGDAAGTSAQAPARFTLAFRLPGWVGDESAAAAAITATGESESGADSSRVTREIRDGYLYLTGEWRDGDTVTFTVTVQSRNYADATCTVTVRLVSYVPGDCNGDGKVTKADLLRLQKYLAKWDVEIDKAAADCNGDGKVTKADLLRLQKYLAGWDVKLG